MGNPNFDGGPAFPFPSDPGVHAGNEGMSLRDYIAIQAMNALIGNIEIADLAKNVAKGNGTSTREMICRKAYEYADAILAERAKAVQT